MRGGSRALWVRLIHDIDAAADPHLAWAIGSVHQALLTGVLVQWLIDPDRAPRGPDLATALSAIAADFAGRLPN
jgi:hypothetical protein